MISKEKKLAKQIKEAKRVLAKVKRKGLTERKEKQKFLKKPKAKGPTPISAKKTLRGFAQSSGPLVREVEEKEIVQDNRSQFFNSEFAKEKRDINKWLI